MDGYEGETGGMFYQRAPTEDKILNSDYSTGNRNGHEICKYEFPTAAVSYAPWYRSGPIAVARRVSGG